MSCFINSIRLSCGSRHVPYGIGTKKKAPSFLLGSGLTLNSILKWVHVSSCFSNFSSYPLSVSWCSLFRGCPCCDSHPNSLLLLHCPQLSTYFFFPNFSSLCTSLTLNYEKELGYFKITFADADGLLGKTGIREHKEGNKGRWWKRMFWGSNDSYPKLFWLKDFLWTFFS